MKKAKVINLDEDSALAMVDAIVISDSESAGEARDVQSVRPTPFLLKVPRFFPPSN